MMEGKMTDGVKIKAWYCKDGTLLTDQHLEGAKLWEISDGDRGYYNVPDEVKFFLAESMGYDTAKIITKALGLNFQGKVE